MSEENKISASLINQAASLDKKALKSLLAVVWNAKRSDHYFSEAIDVLFQSSGEWNYRFAIGVAAVAGKHGREEEQLKILQRLAAEPYPPAQHELGKLHHRHKRLGEAEELYKRSMDAGYLSAGASYFSLKAKLSYWPKSLYFRFKAHHFAERAKSKIARNDAIDEAALFDDWR